MTFECKRQVWIRCCPYLAPPGIYASTISWASDRIRSAANVCCFCFGMWCGVFVVQGGLTRRVARWLQPSVLPPSCRCCPPESVQRRPPTREGSPRSDSTHCSHFRSKYRGFNNIVGFRFTPSGFTNKEFICNGWPLSIGNRVIPVLCSGALLCVLRAALQSAGPTVSSRQVVELSVTGCHVSSLVLLQPLPCTREDVGRQASETTFDKLLLVSPLPRLCSRIGYQHRALLLQLLPSISKSVLSPEISY